MVTLREATPSDRDAVREAHTLAFAGPDAEPVATLACALLDDATALHLVGEAGGVVVGHVAFSPVAFGEGTDLTGWLLAPLGVRPERQKGGIGTRLVEAGLERLRSVGADVALVYGDPAYYGRFGFAAAAAERFTPPYPLGQPFGWLGLPLGAKWLPEQAIPIGCVAPLRDPKLW